MINIDLSDVFNSKFYLKNNEQSLKQFFRYEYYFLSNNLSLNPTKFKENSKVDITSTDNYFTFPMIFSRSIFKALDKNNKKYITITDYIDGLFSIYSGKPDERIAFIFRMFNLNNDEYIHKEDVHLILNYTHIYDNKKKQDLLNSIIEDFFGGHSIFNLEKFTQRIRKKSSGLFFIIMCIFFEHQNFNTNILNILEDEDKNNSFSKMNGGFKRRTGRNNTLTLSSGKSGKIMKYETVYDLRPPSNEAIEYILTNYQMDLSFLKKSEESNTNEATDNSFVSDISDLNGLEEEDILDLNNFEEDILEAKKFLIENALYLNDCILPKGGSNEFTVNSGVITSLFCSKIRNSSISSTRSFNANSLQKKNTCSKSSFAGGHFHSTSSISLVQISAVKDPQSSSYSDFNNNQGMESSNSEIFSEEVLYVKKKNGSHKTYILTLTKGFILVFKRKVGETLTIDNAPVTSKLKLFIPLRHLYVTEVENNIIIGQNNYHQVNFVSTAKFTQETYSFLFEHKARLSEIVHAIITQTKYVSISNEYSYIKDIGRGAFCQIKLMRHIKTNALYSVKKLKKNIISPEEFTTLNWEKDIVKFLTNFPDLENIIKFYKIIESADHIYIVMEYIASGSLGAFIRRKQVCLPSTTVKEIIKQMVNGLRHLHKYGIIHRDLKLENILMDCKDQDKFCAKVIDFGLSQVVTPLAKTKETYGTLIYCSPEILLNLPYNNKVDVWSLGVVAYYLEYTILPFRIRGKEREQQISNMIIMNELEVPKKKLDDSEQNKEEETKAGNLMMAVIKGCLCKDLNHRPSSEQIYSALSKNESKKGEKSK